MSDLEHLLERNRAWAGMARERDPEVFQRIAAGQQPEVFWIGCADSRVSASQILAVRPGRIFVHRNVANLVTPEDQNCQAAMQFAVEALRVQDVVICGHTGCGGVQAVLADSRPPGPLNPWLDGLRQVRWKHEGVLDGVADEPGRADLLAELNVIEQVRNACGTPVVQTAWARGQGLAVHGWLYRLADGLLEDLDTTVTRPGELEAVYRAALETRGA